MPAPVRFVDLEPGRRFRSTGRTLTEADHAIGMQAVAVEFADPVLGALGIKQWSFREPLRIGDTVHTTIEILSRRITRDDARYVIKRKLDLVRSDGVVLQDGIASVLLQMPKERQP